VYKVNIYIINNRLRLFKYVFRLFCDIIDLSNYGGFKMRISYKPLWKLLIDREMTKKELQEKTGLGSSTFTKLKNNECVRTDTLVKICEVLGCKLSEIVECVEDKNVKDSNRF
jgi:hypothetical protein